MPDVHYGISQTGYSIMNQLSIQIRDGLLDRMDVLKNVQGQIYVKTPQRGISTATDRNKNPLVSTNRVFGNCDYVLDPKQVPWPSTNNFSLPGLPSSTRWNSEYPVIWEDTSRGIILRERSVPAALEYDLTLTLETIDSAIRVFDQIKRMVVGEVSNMNFDITYSYPVTTYIFEFFLNAWFVRTDWRQKPLMAYINEFAKELFSFDIRKSQLGEDHPDVQLFIRRRQLYCQAKLSCDAKAPVPQMSNNAVDRYEIPITFQVQFARPFELIGTMPVIVDNQFVNPKMFDKVQITENKHVETTTTSEWQRGFYEKFYPGFRIDNSMMTLPTYDTAVMTDSIIQAMNFVPFLQVAFTIDGPVTKIDLKDINGVGLHPIVKDIILKEKADIFNFEGMFNIRVFAGIIPLNNDLLSLSDDFVLSIKSCGTKYQYRFVISEATKVSYLNKQYYPDLLSYRYFFPMTIMRNLEYLVEHKYFTIASGSQLVSTIQKAMDDQSIYQYIEEWIGTGETTNEIYQYSSNAAQLADFLSNTKSNKQTTTVTPSATATPAGIAVAKTYLTDTVASDNKSLYNTFIATALSDETLSVSDIPTPYVLAGNGYPYTTQQESYYGVTSPLRVINTRFECQQRTKRDAKDAA